MDAVKFLEEDSRMCNTYNDCIGCPIHDKTFCHPHDMTTNDERKELVDAVEKWSKEHPLKTNGMVLMEKLERMGVPFRRTMMNELEQKMEIEIDAEWWDAEYKEKE